MDEMWFEDKGVDLILDFLWQLQEGYKSITRFASRWSALDKHLSMVIDKSYMISIASILNRPGELRGRRRSR